MTNVVELLTEHARWPAGSKLLFAGIIGSHAHGTYIPPTDPHGTDDVDVIGVVLPPPGLVLGIDSWEGCQQWVNEYDIVCYSLQKFVRLLAKSNPNVLSLLALPQDCTLHRTDVWDTLLLQRHLFLTREAMGSFAGYANGQLKRMEHSAYNGYMGEKRKAVVDQFGYDTKNASHLIRLLRMCRDLFTSGNLVVRRPDAAELIAIKRGEWTLEAVRAEADELFRACHAAEEASPLPRRVDRIKVGRLSADLHLMDWEPCV